MWFRRAWTIVFVILMIAQLILAFIQYAILEQAVDDLYGSACDQYVIDYVNLLCFHSLISVANSVVKPALKFVEVACPSVKICRSSLVLRLACNHFEFNMAIYVPFRTLYI